MKTQTKSTHQRCLEHLGDAFRLQRQEGGFGDAASISESGCFYRLYTNGKRFVGHVSAYSGDEHVTDTFFELDEEPGGVFASPDAFAELKRRHRESRQTQAA